jgi:hypothetical protein
MNNAVQTALSDNNSFSVRKTAAILTFQSSLFAVIYMIVFHVTRPDQQAAFVAEERAESDECSCSSDKARMSSLTVNDLLYDRDSDTSLSKNSKHMMSKN